MPQRACLVLLCCACLVVPLACENQRRAGSGAGAGAEGEGEGDIAEEGEGEGKGEGEAAAEGEGEGAGEGEAAAEGEGEGEGEGGRPPCIPDLLGGPDPVEGFFDLTFRGAGFERYEGLAVYVRGDNAVLGEEHLRGRLCVEGGAFSVRWPEAFDPDWFGMSMAWFMDEDGDGECDPGLVFSAFANNTFDAEASHIIVEVAVDGSQVGSFPGGQPIPELCDDWRADE